MSANFRPAQGKLKPISNDRAKLLELLLERRVGKDRQISPGPRRDGESGSRCPTSWAQQRLWFIDQFGGVGAAYNIPLAIELQGDLDLQALEWALNHLVRRHEMLRTVFVNASQGPEQEIRAEVRFPLLFLDLSGYEQAERAEQLRRHKIEEAGSSFDLSSGPLIRGRLLRMQAEQYVLLITMHHIVSDGWSMGLFTREFAELYSACREGREHRLQPLPVQYADYAQWQQQWLQGETLEKQLSYWRGCLESAVPELELPTDRRRPAVQGYRGQNVEVALDAQLTSELNALARRHGMTLFMILYAGWAILLSRLSAQRDVVIGTPVANRPRPELEDLIGLFVNTLVLRVEVTGDTPLREFLQHVKDVTLAAYDHRDTPFEKVVEALRPERSLNRHPIFQVMFALQSASRQEWRLPGLSAVLEHSQTATSKFDLLLSLEERGVEITGSMNYDSDLFDRQTIERWMACFTILLKGMVAREARTIGSLPILPERERFQVIELFNATRATYSREKLIHELFEEQVERTPQAVAVVYEDQSLTYAELNRKSNQLARYLRGKGIGRDQLVGICVERSLEMVVGLLGVLKAGGAYVPLDPNYPSERLAYMLGDAKPSVLLIQESLRERVPDTAAEVIALDRDWKEIADQAQSNLDPQAQNLRSHHLAYVIYTSGSTGKPKGAMNEHRALINRLQWMQSQYQLTESDRVLQKTPFSFDVSVWEFFWTLMSGARLIVARPEGHKDPVYLRQLIDQAGVTTLHFVPSMLQIFLGQHEAGQCRSVRHVVCSGEELSVALQNRCLECLPQARLSNLYGPTEAAVDVTFWDCRLDQQGLSRVPIGRPIANTQMYVLDSHGEPVPIGVAGEIYIGGAGVGRGYLNRPELTAERFLPDPFATDPLARLYKTGDLGRWRADGAIEYLGRNDHQVKIRGFRIELGEIEARLALHVLIKETAVIAREDVPGEKRLVAYVVPIDPADKPSVEDLRAHLKSTLPDYMVPGVFVTLGRLPLSPNGKLDRRALPAPDLGAYVGRRRYEAPRGEVEEILAGILQGLLGLDQVGRHDNFFELGGHSLLIVQMMEKLRRVGLSAELRSVFESPTLADLADTLVPEAARKFAVPPNLIPSDCEMIEPHMLPLIELEPEHIARIVQSIPGGATNIQDIYPLTPLQEGILFHRLLNEHGRDVYTLHKLLSVSSRERLDELITALQHATDRYDVLRTAVLWEQLPRPVQVVCRRAILPVEEIALNLEIDPLQQCMEWLRSEQHRLDVRQAPLMRLRVATGGDGQWCALLQLHHIAIDHVTIEILIAEVVESLEGRVSQLPAPVSYRNHVAQALASAQLHDAAAFFRRKLADITEPTAPFGLLDVHGDGTQIEEVRREVEPLLARRARAQARRLGVSAATLFHAAWGLVVAHTTGRDDVVFGSVLLGRLHGDAGAQRTLGMFINTLPLRLRLHSVHATELIEQTQRELIELLANEQSSLAMAQRCSGLVGSVPLFSALLNYRHSNPSSDIQWSSASGIRVLAGLERTNYPITLSVDDYGEGFTLVAQTDRRIDPQRIAAYLHTAVQSLVEALEASLETPVLSLPFLPASERRQVIELFNTTQVAYPQQNLIHEIFEEQVRRTPNSVAVIHEGRSLLYAQLNGRANRLARYLRKKGVGADQLVGVCVDRSFDMVVGLLGILKAGGAYVPLDPHNPLERLQHMVEDAAPRIVLTQKKLLAVLPASAAEVILLDDMHNDISGYADEDVKADNLTPQNLVYAIYTSGSTGRPKGTGMPHHSMVNLVEWHRRELPAGEGCRVLQFAALSFDVAFQETFSTLCTGGTLVLLDEWVRRDARALLELLSSQSIRRLFVPPLMLQSLAEHFRTARVDLGCLQDVVTAGEQLRISPEIVHLFKHLDGCRLHNHYGPTETHVVTALTLTGNPDEWPALPTIGQPIANTQIYVLDAHRQPTPLGVAGEIYIGGANVARGYLNRPELTAERFIRDHFSSHPLARMYKTGDRGLWREDGAIEYLGRNDDQVKIRGYRIELGEVEAQLARHEKVKEAAVTAREEIPGARRLVAYVTPRDRSTPTVEELRMHLKATLPEYMVPSAFVVLQSLPLTSSGKLNRRALPVPELRAYSASQYEQPQGNVEEVLARIWQELLQVERVGRHDNFFELGGHSLLVLGALFRINQSIGSSLSVSDMYKSPTLQELAERVRGEMIGDDLIDLSSEAALADEIVVKPGVRPVCARAVLLTGGTGFVGRFLLAQLLQDTDAIIYCLVRAQSRQQASSRLRTTLAKWDLWRDEFEPRIVAIPGDLRLPRLGIDTVTYRMLAENIDSIYHCATSMNHLETYAMAKLANVEATRELLQLATEIRPKLVNYISTLGVFSPFTVDTPRVVDEESPIDDEKHLSSRGYVGSKWVGEKIFMTAAQRGIACNIFRLGFVWADTLQGRYDELQRDYRIFKSCLLSGYGIKNHRYDLAPTPVDYVARSIVHLANRHHGGHGIFHIASPRQMVDDVFARCNEIAGTSLTLVSFYDWIHEIKRLHQAGRSLPIVPLVGFAFSMDEESFLAHQRRIRPAPIHFDCTRTHLELEQSGIVAPALDDALLGACVKCMLSRDAELRELIDSITADVDMRADWINLPLEQRISDHTQL